MTPLEGLSTILHPFRTYRVWMRVMCGKPPFKPGSRKDRKYRRRLEERGTREDRGTAEERAMMAEEQAMAAQDARYAEGYDEAFGDDPIWEMDYE